MSDRGRVYTMSLLRGAFSQIGNLASKVESWWALGLLVMSTGGFAWLGNQWGALASQGWAAVLLVALVSSAILILAGSIAFLAFCRLRYNQVAAPPALEVRTEQPGTATIEQTQPNLKMVVNASFENQIVIIDDHHFVKCTFKNCTIQYSGGLYQMIECRREAGEVVFTSYNQEIVRALPLLQFVGLMREDAKGTMVVVPKDAFKS
ncbi:protein of unknown function [Candidatus Filomicrobium marinum]|uniref:Uncharacterized protein n=2 Tax=Candidatus Filomicrobium marinum TaxID=1608628 RepID=A0A0D6JCU0_9HYPH|nr:protein of unknown function [Candidatus Filomicrobium marinum]CPR16494.1 protein of unknown function [Candidatus Filomicrobium marinum]